MGARGAGGLGTCGPRAAGGIHRESRGSGLPGVGGEGTPGEPWEWAARGELAGRGIPGEPWEWAARGDGVHPTVVHPDEGDYASILHGEEKEEEEKGTRGYLPRRAAG